MASARARRSSTKARGSSQPAIQTVAASLSAARLAGPEQLPQLWKQDVAPLHRRGGDPVRAVGRQLGDDDVLAGVGAVARNQVVEPITPAAFTAR